MPARTMIIINPRSAGGSVGRRWPKLAQRLAEGLGPFEHRFTESAGDGTVFARQALAEGHELIVAVGGDGTINEVVNGFFTESGPVATSATLGIMQQGTGGDLRKTLGVPEKLKLAVAGLRGERTRRIDVGRLRYTALDGMEAVRHFVNIASFGISGMVDRLVNQRSKALGGRVAFAWATLQAMRRYRSQRAVLRFDDGAPQQVPLHLVAVANGQYFGGGMHIAPRAQIDDGWFDVVTVGPMTLSDLLLRGHRLYRGTHLDLPFVQSQRARRLEACPLDPADELLLDVDGETPGKLPAFFELLPGALRVRVPEP